MIPWEEVEVQTMKGNAVYKFSVLLAAGLLVVMIGVAAAATMEKDAGKLNAEIALLNSYKSLPQGDKMISKQLSESFDVSSDKISSLYSRTRQYGDVAATLAFADKMSGGLTDANISKVVDMKSRGGWDQVAKNLGVDIGDVAGKLSSVEDDTHKNIKQTLAETFSAGRAAGGVSETPDSGLGEGMTGDMGGEGAGGTDSGTTGGTSGGSTGGGY